ncbi:MAG: hypothetical protein ACOZF0_10035 [Thermodesulfobacteriota bacterium]
MKPFPVLGVLLGLLLAGCAATGVYYPNSASPGAEKPEDASREKWYRENVARLKQRLLSLQESVDEAEAGLAAETAIRESAILAEQYRLVRPARFHNLLIQMGLKERGLCYQWTEDLMKRLSALQLQTLELHWGVAHRGSDLFEHNTVVIAARGAGFHQGLVLDPWRNSGELYWDAVSEDPYPWKPLPPSEW